MHYNPITLEKLRGGGERRRVFGQVRNQCVLLPMVLS